MVKDKRPKLTQVSGHSTLLFSFESHASWGQWRSLYCRRNTKVRVGSWYKMEAEFGRRSMVWGSMGEIDSVC